MVRGEFLPNLFWLILVLLTLLKSQLNVVGSTASKSGSATSAKLKINYPLVVPRLLSLILMTSISNKYVIAPFISSPFLVSETQTSLWIRINCSLLMQQHYRKTSRLIRSLILSMMMIVEPQRVLYIRTHQIVFILKRKIILWLQQQLLPFSRVKHK